MEQSQNTNEHPQPKELHVSEVTQTPEIKEETTADAQPKTNSMEVHKHPHHVMHSKKWHEYLLEFFMLFLAVFLGFVAENIRETSVERNREKEYIESLLADLKNDTTELHLKLQRFSNFPAALNQLANDCNSEIFTDSIQKRMYKANMQYLGTMQIYFTDKTATQLKNQDRCD